MTSKDYVRLLKKASLFALFSDKALSFFSEHFREEVFSSGVKIVAEGGEGERFFLILQGRAEVAVSSSSGPVVMATLGPGEYFGEIALLSKHQKRTASVFALTTLHALSLSREDFLAALDESPDAKKLFEETAEILLRASFLKQLSPFSSLSADRLKKFATSLQSKSVRSGEILLREGEMGSECYLLRQGKVEVTTSDQVGNKKHLAFLETGATFGEAALLSGEKRNATVKAVEPSELLVISRDALLQFLHDEPSARLQFIDLLQLRDRPCRRKTIIIQEYETKDGIRSFILNDPTAHLYYRLTPEGLFLWELLDGDHTLKELTLSYFEKYKAFAPHVIAQQISDLGAAGMIEGRNAKTRDLKNTFHSRLVLCFSVLSRILQWRYYISDVDAWIAGIFQKISCLFFSKKGQCIIGSVVLFGLFSFSSQKVSIVSAFQRAMTFPIWLWWLLPLFLMSILFHEAGHALTVKHFQRRVLGVGFGWYWVGPMFFVDTSDMWTASRFPRMSVTLAGPYAHMIPAGIASIMAFVIDHAMFDSLALLFASLSYVVVLLNLCPLLDFDGYYFLADLLESPNLRARTLRFLKEMFHGNVKLVRHRSELIYIASCMGFGVIFLLALLLLVL